jgi:glycosyltransferase involved in cell wall biosynthesis
MSRRVAIVRQQDVYELGLQREAEALFEAGYDVEVICLTYRDRPRKTVVNGVAITSLPPALRKTNKARQLFEYALFAVLAGGTLTWRHLRRRYAVVQVNTLPDFLVFSALVPKMLGAKVIIHMKEPSPELAELLFGRPRLVAVFRRIEQLAIRFADRTLTVTNQLKQRFVKSGARAEEITVVLTGAPAETYLEGWTPPVHVETEGFTLICPGTMEDRYGHDTIVQAVALLRDELPDLRLVFTGRGSYEERLMALIEELGVGHMARNEGWVTLERLNELLASADVGVVAQKASSYSHLVQTNKMVDYWIFGLPVIHSRLRAVEEMYDDSVLEYYEAGDAAALARAIKRLHDDPARREELARNGKMALETSGWTVQKQIYLGVYEELLSGKP